MFSIDFIAATNKYTDYAFETHVPAPYFRKNFIVDKVPAKAEITICGLGFYRLFINGTEMTKGHLAPYISNPDEILYYDKYDLTQQVLLGKNTIGIILGNGMLNCIGGTIWDFNLARYRSAPKVALTLEITGANGEKTVLTADSSIKTHPSPIVFDDLRCGEIYDARLEVPGWNLPGFDDSSWKNAIPAVTPLGEPRLCTADPIVTLKKLSPIAIYKNRHLRRKDIPLHKKLDGKQILLHEEHCHGYLYDFGENLAGTITLKIKGWVGQQISIQTGETLDENGDLDLRNFSFQPQALNHRILYTLKGEEEETYTPSFTYFGFRYCLISGIDDAQATEGLLTYNVMSSDLEKNGDFTCSDEVVNRLQKATYNADISNFYYFPTDCPHREKIGWTGDAALSAEQMLFNLTPENSYRVWLENIRKNQREDGSLFAYIPNIGCNAELGGPTWDSVLFFLPYYTWMYRGDTKIIKENAGAMMRYLHYLSQQRNKQGLLTIGYEDWACIDYKTIFAPKEVTSTLTAMYICEIASKMFVAVGLEAQSKFARALHDEIREAAREMLILSDGATVSSRSQTGQAMGIAYGLFDAGEKYAAFQVLLQIIHDADDHMDCGVLGARLLFQVLSDFGYSDLAYYMITRPDAPSYGHWILSENATSLFERFQIERRDSQNHHFWGHISLWFLKTISGIKINPRGRDHHEIEIAPHFLESLDHASGYINHAGGRVACSWQREGKRIRIRLEVPENCYGYLQLSGGYYRRPTQKAHCSGVRPLVPGVTELLLQKGEYEDTDELMFAK